MYSSRITVLLTACSHTMRVKSPLVRLYNLFMKGSAVSLRNSVFQKIPSFSCYWKLHCIGAPSEKKILRLYNNNNNNVNASSLLPPIFSKVVSFHLPPVNHEDGAIRNNFIHLPAQSLLAY